MSPQSIVTRANSLVGLFGPREAVDAARRYAQDAAAADMVETAALYTAVISELQRRLRRSRTAPA
jgi:hypothetical protein